MQTKQTISEILAKTGIAALNTMQEDALQTIQDEVNIVLLAPTGSGKTLGFLLPISQLLEADRPGVQCLILSPTRELAIQIERVWQLMGTDFKVNTCYGGHPMQTEVNNLSQPPALLIGTPGRIQEHLSRQTVDLSGVRMLVLDEFDKSLSMGFQEQMTDIINALKGLRKRVLVSATNKLSMPAFTGIVEPKILNYTRSKELATDGLTLRSVVSTGAEKMDTLYRLLCYVEAAPTLVFCNQRESADQVKVQLARKGISSEVFHGGLEQLDREKTLIRFRNGSIHYLIASDLAARGLDIPDVQNVIHFELPQKNNDFLHRNGRTARMHAAGTAYLMITDDDLLPLYLDDKPEVLILPDIAVPPPPSVWTTIYISGGKKDKLSKTDIMGFFGQKAGLTKEDVGKIELLDFMAFVAVKKTVADDLLQKIQNEKMKGKKYKIGIAH